jgi:hypothetical protein
VISATSVTSAPSRTDLSASISGVHAVFGECIDRGLGRVRHGEPDRELHIPGHGSPQNNTGVPARGLGQREIGHGDVVARGVAARVARGNNPANASRMLSRKASSG